MKQIHRILNRTIIWMTGNYGRQNFSYPYCFMNFGLLFFLIKGYVEILSDKNAKDNHPKALESISKNIERIEELYESLAEYLGELNKRNPDT